MAKVKDSQSGMGSSPRPGIFFFVNLPIAKSPNLPVLFQRNITIVFLHARFG